MGSGSGKSIRIAIWDRPTRIFHWALVLLIPFMWWTAEQELLELHRLGGYTILGLLLFRFFWGLFGSSTARFAGFVRGPRAVFAYLRGRWAHAAGHSPVGALSVLAMLAALSAQVGLGLFASDEDGLETGPLAHLVSIDLSEEITELHEDNFDLILVLIGLHVAAILFYAIVKRKNLVGPMITGSGEAPEGTAAMTHAPAWRFYVAATLAAAATLWVVGAF